MTRKDYNALANAVAGVMAAHTLPNEKSARVAICVMAATIADVCAADNPRFDRRRFYLACGVPVR